MRRRQFLAGLGILWAGLATACSRITQRELPTLTPSSPPEVEGWREEILGILSDSLNTLRTYDVFAAYRVATAAGSSRRLPSELTWDPPTGKAWDSATHVSQGLYGRADQLLAAITNASIDPALWRTQRDLADITHALIDVGDALRAYRSRIARVPPGDASSALDLLDRAWAQWETTASRIGLSRSEPIANAS